jgi:hypothetical protein
MTIIDETELSHSTLPGRFPMGRQQRLCYSSPSISADEEGSDRSRTGQGLPATQEAKRPAHRGSLCGRDIAKGPPQAGAVAEPSATLPPVTHPAAALSRRPS